MSLDRLQKSLKLDMQDMTVILKESKDTFNQ